jgi:hypothetical protein
MVTEAQYRTMATPSASTGIFVRMVSQLQRFICGLHGHDALLHFEKGRLSLQCTSCGYETPGWDVRESPGRSRTEGKARIVQMPLVRHRRVA